MTKEITKDHENMIAGHVGARVRQRRKAKGMTQQALAEAIGVKFQQVQKYETGANRIAAPRLFMIAEELGVDLGYFFIGLPAMYALGGTPDQVSAQSQIEADILRAVRLCRNDVRVALLTTARAAMEKGGDA